MAFRMVVFDMAGTTVRDDGLVAAALIAALGAHGCPIEFEAAQALMGYAKPEAIRRLLMESGQPAGDERIAHVHADFIQVMLETYRHDPRVAPTDGAHEAFAELKRNGILVALNTAFSSDIADAIVTRLGWQDQNLIDAVICADQVAQGRPAPDMIRALMAQLGVSNARQVVKVGDTEVDIREGRNAQCGMVIAVTTGAYARADLVRHSPDHVIDHLDELLPLVQSFKAA